MPWEPIGRRWTAQDNNLLAKLLREGTDYRLIAVRMRRTYAAVKSQAKKIPQSERRLVELGLKAK